MPMGTYFTQGLAAYRKLQKADLPGMEIKAIRTGFNRDKGDERDGYRLLVHRKNDYLIPGRRRGCSPVKALGFAEHLRSYASLFAGEHRPVTAAIPSCKEPSISWEHAGGTGTHF